MTKKNAADLQDVDFEERTDDAIVDKPTDADEPDPAHAADSEMVSLTYRGDADRFNFGSTTLLPGIPTLVSKEAAEGILTTPFEAVEITPVTDEPQLEE